MSSARHPTSPPSESFSTRLGPSIRTPPTSWGVRISTPKRRAWATARRARSFPLRPIRSEEHTSELQSQSNLVCRLLLEKKKNRAPEHCILAQTVHRHEYLPCH